jgi:hypothetical protein
MNFRENAIEDASRETVQWIFDEKVGFTSESYKLILIDRGSF